MEYRYLEDYPKYRIYKDGRIYSEHRHRFLKPTKNKKGYLIIRFSKNNIPKAFQVHRLVAMVWIPNPNNLPQVNHKDENKLNNNVENLEWCTNWYNCHYGTKIARGGEKQKIVKLREKNGMARGVVAYDVITHEKIKEFDCMMSACDYFHLPLTAATTGHIGECCRNKVNQAYGY